MLTDEYFQQEAASYIAPDKILLDAGCGKWGITDDELYRLKNKLSIGLDASFDALKSRTCFDHFIQGMIEAQPFRDERFDVILSYLVFEHLEDPESAIREFHRILKQGGGVVITTNSIFNPVMLLSHLLPIKARDWIKRQLLLIHDDSFPTYYRFNSLGRIQKVMIQRGFEKLFATYSSTPYSGEQSSSFNRALSKVFIFWDRVTDFKWLQRFKMNLVVHYIKQ
jgi:SAM-dependent methyltransferase